MPIDRDEPALKKVPRIPAAAPRCSGGDALMIIEALGEENMPEPTPFRNTSAANSG